MILVEGFVGVEGLGSECFGVRCSQCEHPMGLGCLGLRWLEEL